MGEESEYANANNGASAARQMSNGTMGASMVPGEGRTEVAEERAGLWKWPGGEARTRTYHEPQF